jgi:midasin
LAIRILQLYFRGADHWFEEMVKRYLGEDKPDSDIHGSWDDRTIDYRFLTLWEEDRFRRVLKLINDVKPTSDSCLEGQGRILDSDSFDNSIALAGGLLLPRTTDGTISPKKSTSSLISTSTVSSNLRRIASAMKSTSPLLIEGISGAGKSLLIRHLAQSLGKLDDMVTLHLNQQSDAKLLMGIYTTGLTPGSFVWKPGVLTTAVQEGRWVLIEDLDRAPDEIIGTILPLIERGELTIPNRQTTIRATSGFRIIATARTTINHRGQHASPVTDMLGIRHWQQVSIQMPPSEELQQITRHLYPTLSGLLPQLHAVYERLHASWREASVSRQSRVGTARNLSPRDLLKWCDRVSKLLRIKDTIASTDMDDVLLEAMDCFAGALPDSQPRGNIAALIAEELRIDPQRRDYLITQREVGYRLEDCRLRIGRYNLVRASQSRRTKASQSSFSTNPHTNRMLEKVAGAVINREPLLLVGETGVGKTAAVQHLATNLGKELVPFNLSQQSEAGDLLGGFKPANARSLFVPLKDEFDDLFAESFSLSKNQQFLDLLGKQTSRSNWTAVCKLWQQALKMVDQQRMQTGSRQGEAPSKKRKVESKKAIDFGRWDAFAVKVTDMERRLASGDEAFAFSFVEGNIVKALRNGDWILLDEINLASPDTLEAIADLLDPDWPSLLLTESGSIERIEAHPSFRLFAAMNPATDVGKKDLPPGIRSRFTELYIESPDSDLKSLSSIVQSYLRHEIVSDQAVPMDVSKLYQKILELASQNRLVDGAGSSPHFSLRTLTRTLGYAKYIAPFCSLRRALFEGFHMSFLTLLDNESAQLVRPLIEQSLFGKRSNIRAELQRALRKPTEHHVQGYPGSKHWVHSGELPIEEQPHYILTPFIRNNLENLVRATSTRRFPVLIQGPTSSGKTSMIEYLAKRTGHTFVRINNHEHTDLQEYLGTYVSGPDGHLQFQDGILVEALREGHWLVLDELNLAPSDVLEALNRLLDDNRELLIPETQEVVRPHESFMLFATQNPAGLYGGRKVLSRAFRNRFLELHFNDIPIDELQEILHRRTELPESRCKRIVSVYRELSVLRQENRLFEQKSFATLRDLFRWAQRPNDTIEELAANGFMLMGERVRKAEERKLLKDTIERVMTEKTVGTNGFRVKVDEGQLYSSGSREVTHYERNAEDKGVVWTKAIRRLYVLVARALENNEPVLLVGETGCGKTTVCQMLAHALGKKLHCVNAHQNTETGDLIGSQRPIRNRAVIEAGLRHQLLSSELLQNLDSATEHSTNTLLDSYDYALASLPQDQKSTYIQSATHAAIQRERTRFKALFEWVDGSLVQAMREGAFFLLDEISLADDSVLERINSVLEPQRSILLAEKGSIDSSITAGPGFQFLATMNPGGDYGKRELSPALRNRFTEIWVPPLNDSDDIIQIVHEKSIPEAKNFAHGMIKFAQWFKDRYNTTASSSISIRDALSWATFVNSYGGADVGAAVVHGAAMVYVDTLGANPSGLMATSRLGIDQERTICVDNLAQYLGLDAHAIYFAPPQLRLAGDKFTMGPFSLSKRHAATGASNFSFEAPTTRTNTVRVIRALQLPKPIMLEGDPGVGKTALITAIAEVAGISLTRINLSEQTDLMDLFGSDVPLEGAEAGHFAWRDAPFLRAMQNGEWVLLDEMNLASQSVLEGLNACLDHRGEVFVPELGQTFTRHPDFRLFAAQNPHHQGGGRKGLPASFVNRFTVVYADAFRPDDLKLISQQSFPGIDQSTIEKVVAFVNQLSDETSQQKRIGVKGAPWEFNYRDISRLLTLATSEQGLLRAGSTRDFTNLLLSQRFRSAPDRAFVDEVFRRCFGDDLYNTSLFSTSSSSHIQLGLAILPKRSIVAQPVGLRPRTSGHGYHLEILQSIMLCVQLNWPVILVGRSGTGKSELLERLAATVGVSMATLTINAETDTMDLIGGFEQTDSTWQMEQAQLALTEQSDVDALTELKVRATLNNQSSRPQQDIEGDQTSADNTTKPKFEWIDGILIDALREGKWLILDNANLCSPSVLDRLNSLLEPNGVLIVNERNNADGSPRIITPHPQFRIFLTMNPRYGELSRAMRNRAVELYFPESPTPDTNKSLDPLFSESAVSRLRQIQTLDYDAADEADIDCVAHTMVDHLTPVDEVLLLRLTAQILTGLYNIPDAVRQSLNKTVQARSQIQVDTVQRSIQLYEAVLSQTQVPADFARVQVSRLALRGM